MKSEIFPEILYVVNEYDVFEVRLIRAYNLLACARYESTFHRCDVFASDISKTAFHSKRNAWKHVELKVRGLAEWVGINLSTCKSEEE